MQRLLGRFGDGSCYRTDSQRHATRRNRLACGFAAVCAAAAVCLLLAAAAMLPPSAPSKGSAGRVPEPQPAATTAASYYTGTGAATEELDNAGTHETRDGLSSPSTSTSNGSTVAARVAGSSSTSGPSSAPSGSEGASGAASASGRTAGDLAAGSAWRTNGTLALTRLVSAVGRTVAVAAHQGSPLVAEAARALPQALTVHDLCGCSRPCAGELGDTGSWASQRTAERDADAAAHDVSAPGAQHQHEAARLRRNESLRAVSVVDVGCNPSQLPAGEWYAAVDNVEDVDVFVVDATALAPGQLRPVLLHAVAYVALHLLIVGLPCDDADGWRAVSDAVAAPPARETWFGVGDASRLDRLDFFCHVVGSDASAGGARLVAAHRHPRRGAALLTRRPVWPSLLPERQADDPHSPAQHSYGGWRILRWPQLKAGAPIEGLPRTVSTQATPGGDRDYFLLADMRTAPAESTADETFRAVYRVPVACTPRLGTPFQKTFLQVQGDTFVVASDYALPELPDDTMFAHASGGTPMAEIEPKLQLEPVDAHAHSRPPQSDSVNSWSLAYAGRFCGMTVTQLLFTVDRPLFQSIALPLVETLWEEHAIPSLLFMHRYFSLPGLHVTTYPDWNPPRRYIAWQMEYEQGRLASDVMVHYLKGAEAVWEYAADNMPTLAAPLPHNLSRVLHVPPCYHPSTEIELGDGEIAIESDVAFLGSFEPPRRQRMWPRIQDAASIRIGHLLLGGSLIAFAKSATVNLNVHAHENAVLELTRLIPLMANGVFVLTEAGRDADLNAVVQDGVAMVRPGRDNVVEGIKQWIGDDAARVRGDVTARGRQIVKERLSCRTGAAKIAADLKKRCILPDWLPWWSGDRPPLDEAGT